MGRKAARIGQEELEQRILRSLLEHENGPNEEDISKDGRLDLISTDLGFALCNLLRKDVKVRFDGENFDAERGFSNSGEHLSGFHTLDNGLTFLGCESGGDWEHPVFFVVYWDGKKIRAYVPTDGNPWNTDTKEAYGNNHGLDFRNAVKRYPEMYSGLLEELEAEAEDLDDDDPPSIVRDDVGFEWDKIKADIKGRISVGQ